MTHRAGHRRDGGGDAELGGRLLPGLAAGQGDDHDHQPCQIGHFGGRFALLLDAQDHSQSHSGVMITGRVDDGHPDTVRGLAGSTTLTVALAPCLNLGRRTAPRPSLSDQGC